MTTTPRPAQAPGSTGSASAAWPAAPLCRTPLAKPPDDGRSMDAMRARQSRTQTPSVESGDRRGAVRLPQGTLVAIAGGKNVSDAGAVINRLDKAKAKYDDMVLVHGGGPGVERIAAQWAERIRATLDRIAPEYDVTPIAPATDLSRIAIYIALTADRNPAFPTLSPIARARTEAPVHGVSPATAHMPRIVHAIRPRSHHRRSVPAAPLDKTANLLEHCRSNAHRRETVNRTQLCARIAARSTSTRADAATARRVGAEIPAPGKPSPSPPHRSGVQGRQDPLRPARRTACRARGSVAPVRPRTAARAATLFRDPPAATRRPRFAAAFANSPAPSPQPVPRSLRACDYLAAAFWMSIASGASGFL